MQVEEERCRLMIRSRLGVNRSNSNPYGDVMACGNGFVVSLTLQLATYKIHLEVC